MNALRPTLLLGFLICATLHASAAQPPVQVFILAGQSNMEGQAVVDLDGKDYNGGKGTLASLFNDPDKASLFKHLKTANGEWAVRKNVWVRYKRENGPLLAGPLGLGFSVYGDKHHFGPELQFGHVVGDRVKGQVLLIKTAWGGKSLFQDFRPPSSSGTVGPYYTKMLAEIHEGLANLKTDFPGYAGQGYELAGFVWYQGWNDGVDPKGAIPEYEQNLVNLIRDVRRDLKAPSLPVVVGELTGPWIAAAPQWTRLRQAQRAATERPEFKGNVRFVETRDFVRRPEDSPNPGHGHHEFGNAETYLLIGGALGKGMVALVLNTAARPDDGFARAMAEAEREIRASPKLARGWLRRAELFDAHGDYPRAVAEYGKAIKLDPKSADAWQRRGEAQFKRGAIAESIMDFDKALELEPDRKPYHWQRGISLYYAGRFAEGKQQFALHQTVNPHDVENAVWHFLCTARAEGMAAAKRELIPIEGDARIPMAEVHKLFAGSVGPEAVLESARAATARSRAGEPLFYANLYLGLYYEAIGDNKQAREYIFKAAERAGDNGYMGHVARIHAESLNKAKPTSAPPGTRH